MLDKVKVTLEKPAAICKRKEKRYQAGGQAQMPEAEVQLKDISLSGGRIQSHDFLDVIPNGKYTIAIIPEKESHVGKFEVDILSRWVRMNKSGSESGFIMVLPAGSRILEDYVEFLKTKNVEHHNAGQLEHKDIK